MSVSFSRSSRPFALATLLAGLALAVSGCGTGSVSASEVEEKAADALEAQVGSRPDVSCPDDLKGEEGATVDCTLTAPDGSTIGMTATATSVDGGTVQMDFQVDDAPSG